MTEAHLPNRTRRGARVLASASLLALLFSPLISSAQETQAPEPDLQRFVGDYTVAVYPQPFGFIAREGTLYLRVGGVEGDGQEAPLLAEPNGRFVIESGHPNAFQFELVDDEVRFTFWAAGNSFPGTRVGAATEELSSEPPEASDERTRHTLLAERSEAESAFRNDPESPERRFRYGDLLFQSGQFWQAEEVLRPLAADVSASSEALSLSAKLAYLTANYERAEQLYTWVIQAEAGNVGAQVMAKVGLLFTHYQQNEFFDASNIPFPDGVTLPNRDLMAAFEEAPYQLRWHGDERKTSVPFLVTDPLPVLAIEVDGRPLHMLFDTGADTLIVDTAIAEELGIEWVAQAMGTFGGGLKAEVGFGKVERVTLGGVSLSQVPVAILPTQRFSSGFADGRYTIAGIIGTQLLRQFLSTLDYENGRLTLRERNASNAREVRRALGERLTEIPFVLDLTHLMMARGRLNDSDDLTFFVDSGLDSEAVLAVPIQTLDYLGITAPKTEISEEAVGGGGGKFASGLFELDLVALGELDQRDVKGEYGALVPESYWARGYIQDALISHQFLRRYSSWTLDFDSMTFLFGH